MSHYIGIDVSKATINVHISKNSQDLVLENSIKGFKSLSSKLKKIYKKEIENIVFIFEPTGSYSAENYGNQNSSPEIPAKASISCQVSSDIPSSRFNRSVFSVINITFNPSKKKCRLTIPLELPI